MWYLPKILTYIYSEAQGFVEISSEFQNVGEEMDNWRATSMNKLSACDLWKWSEKWSTAAGIIIALA